METPQTSITKEVYELHLCLLGAALSSTRRASILNPIPPHFLEKNENTCDFEKLRKTLDAMPDTDTLFKNKRVLEYDEFLKFFKDDQLELIKFLFKKISFELITNPNHLKEINIPNRYVKPDYVFKINYSKRGNDFHFWKFIFCRTF